MSRMLLQASLMAAALLGAAGNARAQDAAANAALFSAVRRAPAEAAPLPFPRREPARSAAGVAQTSVERPLAGGGLTGSLGFLCGLQPTPDIKGGASAYGADDQGRFLGAKLHFAFR